MKSLLASVDALPASQAADVLARVPPALLAAVASGHGGDWLPVEGNLALTRAIHDALGPAAFRAFFRQHTLGSFRGPLLGPVVAALVGALGGNPAAWASWVPRVWRLLFGACGTWAVEERGPGTVKLWFEQAPAACIEDEVWLDSVAASVAALADVNRVKGDVEVLSVDRTASLAVFELRWTA
jgi:hypothetical protein